MPLILPITDSSLDQAAALLRAGQVCAFPTETVYGLGADARSAQAVARIYALKGRPATNPLIVHVRDIAEAQALAAAFPALALSLARRFWPGPLTLVVPRGPDIPAVVSAGLATVALRVPAHPVALQLLQRAGLPVAAPSANRSEGLSPTCAAHVARGLPGVPLVLDGGPCRLGIESTVVDVSTDVPVLLRPGALSLYELRQIVPGIRLPPSDVVVGAASSPGQSARHYAPRAPLRVVTALDPFTAPAEAAAQVGFLVYADLDLPEGAGVIERLPADPAGYAADLYAALHRLDDAGVGAIYVQAPPAGEAWLAVRDRLRRAAVSAT